MTAAAFVVASVEGRRLQVEGVHRPALGGDLGVGDRAQRARHEGRRRRESPLRRGQGQRLRPRRRVGRREGGADGGADSLAVAIVDEGIELRASGVTAPILLLGRGPRPRRSTTRFRNSLTLTVGSVEGALDVVAVAEPARRDATACTSRSTPGCTGWASRPTTSTRSSTCSSRRRSIDVEGIYTHFSVADGSSAEDRAFTRAQIELFDRIVVRDWRRAAPCPSRARRPTAPARSVTPSRASRWCASASRSTAICPRRGWRGALEEGGRPGAGTDAARQGVGRAARRGGRASELRATPGARTAVHDRHGPLRLRRRLPAPALRRRRARSCINGRRYPLAGMVTMDKLVIDCGDDRSRSATTWSCSAPRGRGDHGRRVGRARGHHLLGDPLRRRRAGAPPPRGLDESRDLNELPTCTRCALSLTRRQRVVVGSGPRDPALMVIGEAPGRDEDEGGEPFIGRSGRLLFQLIEEEVGLARAECFVTNVVKCRPPANRTPDARRTDGLSPVVQRTAGRREPRRWCWPWAIPRPVRSSAT